ncbi:MAG: Lsm family RNA-binding protein [Promethearchaeota archaeon]
MSMDLKIKINYNREVNSMLNQEVRVELQDSNSYYEGILTGFNLTNGSLTLSDAKNAKNEKFTKIVLHGNIWATIYTIAPSFPMKDLADSIAKNFPAGQVKFDPDTNTINILNGKIIVSEAGIEGSGPTAARVKKMYDEFLEDLNK